MDMIILCLPTFEVSKLVSLSSPLSSISWKELYLYIILLSLPIARALEHCGQSKLVSQLALGQRVLLYTLLVWPSCVFDGMADTRQYSTSRGARDLPWRQCFF